MQSAVEKECGAVSIESVRRECKQSVERLEPREEDKGTDRGGMKVDDRRAGLGTGEVRVTGRHRFQVVFVQHQEYPGMLRFCGCGSRWWLGMSLC